MWLPLRLHQAIRLKPHRAVVGLAALSFTMLGIGVVGVLKEGPSYTVATFYSPMGSARALTSASGLLHGHANSNGSACFWLGDGDQRAALMWPNRYRARGTPLGVFDQDGNLIAVVGQYVELDGSTTAPEDTIAMGRTTGIPGCPPMPLVVMVARQAAQN